MEEVDQDLKVLTGLQATLEAPTGAGLDDVGLDDPMEEETEEDPYLAAFDFDYGSEENAEAHRLGYEAFKAKFWGPDAQPK